MRSRVHVVRHHHINWWWRGKRSRRSGARGVFAVVRTHITDNPIRRARTHTAHVCTHTCFAANNTRAYRPTTLPNITTIFLQLLRIRVRSAYHGHVTAIMEVSPYKFNQPGAEPKPHYVHVVSDNHSPTPTLLKPPNTASSGTGVVSGRIPRPLQSVRTRCRRDGSGTAVRRRGEGDLRRLCGGR